MTKPEFIARQSAHPSGWLGHVVALVMARDTARANRNLLARLEPKPGERILELGCGHGRTLRRVAERIAPGFAPGVVPGRTAGIAPGLAAGVDPSPVMRRVARRHLRRALAAGHACIDDGDAADIPHASGRFDKAFSMHTLYFWPDLGSGLRELRRVLREGGELLLGFHDGADAAKRAELPASVYTLHRAETVADALEAARFHEIACDIDPDTRVCFARARRGGRAS